MPTPAASEVREKLVCPLSPQKLDHLYKLKAPGAKFRW